MYLERASVTLYLAFKNMLKIVHWQRVGEKIKENMQGMALKLNSSLAHGKRVIF